MKIYSLVLFMLLAVEVKAQQVTLDSCYKWAKINYPIIKKAELIVRSNAFSLSNIQKGYLPQLSLNGQATYQSDVTSVSGIPGITIDPLSKDQYKGTIDLNQSIYDGGQISQQKKVEKASSDLQLNRLDQDLYALNDRLNQIYFGILLLDIQIEQNTLLVKELNDTKQRVEASLVNGRAYKSDVDQLQVEVLLQAQRRSELEAGLNSYLRMLSAFTGRQITSATQVAKPDLSTGSQLEVNNRLELTGFELQRKLYDNQINLINAKERPRLNAFAEGGYGKPGFNQLKNEFDWFYIGGIKLTWNFTSFYTSRKEKLILKNNQQDLDVQRETFLFNNNLSLIQQKTTQAKIKKMIETDGEIISLKEKIKLVAKAKYENGVITLNDYLKEINALDQAKLNKRIHEINELSNEFNQQFILGN